MRPATPVRRSIRLARRLRRKRPGWPARTTGRGLAMSAADSTLSVRAEILLPFQAGSPPAVGRALALTHPISFWGGVDPSSGAIIDARHPQRGECVAGRILLLPGTIGSSSAAAVMLELVHAGHA